MKTINEITPKQADAYKDASLKDIERAIEIIDFEYHKLTLIRREMIAAGKATFKPTDYGIDEYIPHLP